MRRLFGHALLYSFISEPNGSQRRVGALCTTESIPEVRPYGSIDWSCIVSGILSFQRQLPIIKPIGEKKRYCKDKNPLLIQSLKNNIFPNRIPYLTFFEGTSQKIIKKIHFASFIFFRILQKRFHQRTISKCFFSFVYSSVRNITRIFFQTTSSV